MPCAAGGSGAEHPAFGNLLDARGVSSLWED